MRSVVAFTLAMGAWLAITFAFGFNLATNKSPRPVWAIGAILSLACAVVEFW